MFLGPQAENAEWFRSQLIQVLDHWIQWRRTRYPDDGIAISRDDQSMAEFIARKEAFADAIRILTSRFEQEVPKFSPRYIGHMFSETALPALFGHVIALLHNPNNISGESARVGVQIEDEAVRDLLNMIGYDAGSASGHFTSCGTIANFEALVRARARLALWLSSGLSSMERAGVPQDYFSASHLGWKRAEALSGGNEDTGWNFVRSGPFEFCRRAEALTRHRFDGPVVLIPENKHYSWKKGASLVGLGDSAFWPIRLDARAKLDVAHLGELIERARTANRPILCVVSVAGSTELAAFDPVHRVQDLLDDWRERRGVHVWHHVDAAYGGFFCAMGGEQNENLGEETRTAIAAIRRADSVTLDPHKLGYVPYSSGAFLAADSRDYFVQSFDAPYVQFDPKRDRGPFTLEGSRSASGALATWMIARTVGLDPEGYGRIISRTLSSRRKLEYTLREAKLPIQIAPDAETNILCFSVARRGDSLTEANRRTEALYRRLSPQGDGPYFVSKTQLRWPAYGNYLDQFLSSWDARIDAGEVTLIRMCLMNPFFDSKESRTVFPADFTRSLERILNSI